jgi:hypothetical protein
MTTIQLKLKPWMAPNFAVPERPPGRREDGVHFDTGIPISSLPVDVLSQMCDDWRAEVFRKAGKKDPRHD